jgi:flagellar biosynthetic protein FliP
MKFFPLFLFVFLLALPMEAQSPDAPVASPALASLIAPVAPSAVPMASPGAPMAPSAAPMASPTPGFPFNITIGLNGAPTEQGNVSTAIQIVFAMTLLSLAPSIMMLMTSFTRIVIVLGFLRSAMGVQNAPSNQIIIGMSIFLTMFIMAPIANRINTEALQPYMDKKMSLDVALDKGSGPLKQFMLKQTRPSEIDFFLGISGKGATKVDQLPMTVVIPSFVVSELRTSFQMGFLIYIPFLVIDFVVASTLMSMGMMMMPPVMISLPFKLLLFVLVDGWHLVIQSLVKSFGL